jgi:glycosyltransferase involved in cell wall biosynthesis
MNNSSPLISVILPVYNAEPYLKDAIESILNQSFVNFEFIIINDGSTDNSEKTILSFNDLRIKYVSQQNKGLGETLNIAINLAIGKYIARQDQDDISHIDRLKKQVVFLEKNSTILLVGSRAKIFRDDNSIIDYHNHAIHPVDLKYDLLFDNPFVHSSVMFCKSAINKVGGYNSDRKLYEDYNLWSRFSYIGDLANLPEVLLDYRHHEKGLSSNTANFKEYALFDQGLSNLKHLLGNLNQNIIDLEALYHWKKEKYSGSSIKELFKGLDIITDKLISMYPQEIERLQKRKKQYQKIILYRLNIMERRTNPSLFRLLMLKIENKILGLHAFVKN